MKNKTPPPTVESSALAVAEPDLIHTDVKDLKLRISRADILELCVVEQRRKLQRAEDEARQRCVASDVALKDAKKKIEEEVVAHARKHFSKIIRALRRNDVDPVVVVDVVYAGKDRERSLTKEDPPSTRWRSTSHSFVGARVTIGDQSTRSTYEQQDIHTEYQAFHAGLPKRVLGDITSISRYGAAVKTLSEACDAYDLAANEVRTFDKAAKASKHEILTRILETSPKGREVLALVSKLSKEIRVTPKALGQPVTIDVS